MKILLSLLFIFSTLVTFADHHGKKKPLKAFMITGGCCHDYPKQKKISLAKESVSEYLPSGISFSRWMRRKVRLG
jgi:hypothetical protein